MQALLYLRYLNRRYVQEFNYDSSHSFNCISSKLCGCSDPLKCFAFRRLWGEAGSPGEIAESERGGGDDFCPYNGQAQSKRVPVTSSDLVDKTHSEASECILNSCAFLNYGSAEENILIPLAFIRNCGASTES